MAIPSSLATGFTRLSPSTYLYTPAPSSPRPPAPLILLCTWMNATPRQASLYFTTHKKLYPHSRILLVTCTSADFFYRPLNTQLQRLAPAIPEIVSSAGGLLAHVFSNGGAHSLITVATAYRTATGVALPIRGLVLDSAPAGGDNDTTVRTFSVLLQETPWWVKAPGMAGTYAFFYGFVALAEALGPSSFKYQNPVERVRAGLNDVKLLGGGGKRTYIFGKGDAMVDPVDVERHAEEAKKMGMWTVKTERFDESAHVAHVREGKERYWAVVQQCWHEDGPKL